MKKSKPKSPRKKVIPRCFQKKSKSNTSLSKLLHIASYKKRINDLVYNNRRLAKELQNARCEVAVQNKIIEKNASDRNLIMFAKLKMNDMAQSITKLVSDLDEVQRCFDNLEFPSNEVNFQTTKGFPCRKAIPTVDCIEEVSVLSGSDPISDERTPSPPVLLSVPAKTSVTEKGASVIGVEMDAVDSTSANDFSLPADVPSILFVEEQVNPEESIKKQKSSKKKSSVVPKTDQRSLTPELDIDFPIFPNKKSSSRRQTQLFKVSDSRRSKSKEKVISPEAPLSPLIFSQTSSKESTNRLENLSAQDSKGEIFLQISSGLHDHTAKSIPSDDHLLSIMPVSTVSNFVTDVSHSNVLPPQKPNCTLLLDEDMELTDILTVNPIKLANVSVAGYNPFLASQTASDSTIGVNFSIISENKYDTTKKDASPKLRKTPERKSNTPKKCVSPKLDETPKRKSFTLARGSQNFVRVSSVLQSINSDVNSPVMENKKFEQNITPLLHDSLQTPSPSKTRRRKQVQYVYFTSSDSEECDTPRVSKSQKKKNSNVKNRTTAIFIPKQQQDTPKDCLSLSKSSTQRRSINHELKTVSVESGHNSTFDFNSSVSEKNNGQETDPNFLPRKSKLSRKRKPIKSKTPTKPLFHNCNVKKKKGFDYQFSKRKSNIQSPKLSTAFNQTNTYDSPSNKNACSSPGPFAPHPHNQTENYLEQSFVGLLEKDITNSVQKKYKSVLKSPATPKTPGPEIKRVSFATTDMVCKFRKMSISKTIAANAKVRRASKSASELEDCFHQDIVKHLRIVDNSSKKTEDDNDDLFLNFDEETELYAVSVSVNAQCSEQKTMIQKYPPKTVSLIQPQTEKLGTCDENPSNKMDLNKNKRKTDMNKNKRKTNMNKNNKETDMNNKETDMNKNEKETDMNKNEKETDINKNKKETDMNKKEKEIDMNRNKKEIDINRNKKETNDKKPNNTSETGALCLEKPRKKISLFRIDAVSKSIKTPPQKAKNRISKKVILSDSKENLNQQNTTTVKFSNKSKEQSSKRSVPILPHNRDGVKTAIDDIMKCVTSENLKSVEKIKKKHPFLKSVESSPVLKDMINLESKSSLTRKASGISSSDDGGVIEIPRRRSKPVSYKEPKLNKKMRRE